MATGSINFQQLPGVEQVLTLFRSRPGHKLICTDLASVEPRIVAFFSRDPTLLELYATGKPHDVYLFLAMHIFQDEGPEIRKAYDPNGTGPTEASRDATKRQFAKLRKIAKEIQLACLEEGTPVRVRGMGWVAIEQVQPGDFVWDGVQWVQTDGPVYKGMRQVHNLHGVSMTRDHLVLTTRGWRESGDVLPTECIIPEVPRVTLAEVRGMILRGSMALVMGLLCGCITMAHRLRSWWRTVLGAGGVQRRVYDLVNCGPGSRFVAGGIIAHNCGYGASAWRVWQTLRLKGIDITLAECEKLVDMYWRLFAGVRRWTRTLEREADERGGWILNGRGRPLAVPLHRRKDIGNMFAQSTGHDCLLTLVWHIDRIVTERGLGSKMHPWLADVHDATIYEVEDGIIEEAESVFVEAYRRFNDELQSDVPLIGDIEIGDNLWKFKG